MGGQRRAVGIGGMAGGLVFTGWDLTAAFGLAEALRVPAAVVAEFVTDIEPIAMAAMNRQLGDAR
jgi:hypothetical protein